MKKLGTVVILLAFFLTSISAQVNEQSIPLESQVGTACMPSTIGPITAPFAMPKLDYPTFPSRSLRIDKAGAKPEKLSTAAIQKAIDKISRQGGGTVVVPAGSWLTGRIVLKDNVNFHLDKGAELHFSGAMKDFMPVVFTRNEGVEIYSTGAFIYANGAHNIALTGEGKLIGPSTDCEIFKGQVTAQVEGLIDAKSPVKGRIYDGTHGRPNFLPKFFGPVNCKQVFVEGVTFEHAIFWIVVPTYCENVIIRGIKVGSKGMVHGDGIDIDSSTGVLIEYCTLDCGDDCFTIKSGRNDDGLRVGKPSENIVVRYCLAKQGGGGVVCGSETAGMIRNLYVHDCVFDSTSNGLLFKTRRLRGGGGEHLYFERIRMNLPGNPAVYFEMLGSPRYSGEWANRYPVRQVIPSTPSYHDVFIKDLLIENAGVFVKVTGIPESPMRNTLIENCKVNCAQAFDLSDMDELTVKNATIQVPKEAGDKFSNASGLSLQNVTLSAK